MVPGRIRQERTVQGGPVPPGRPDDTPSAPSAMWSGPRVALCESFQGTGGHPSGVSVSILETGTPSRSWRNLFVRNLFCNVVSSSRLSPHVH